MMDRYEALVELEVWPIYRLALAEIALAAYEARLELRIKQNLTGQQIVDIYFRYYLCRRIYLDGR